MSKATPSETPWTWTRNGLPAGIRSVWSTGRSALHARQRLQCPYLPRYSRAVGAGEPAAPARPARSRRRQPRHLGTRPTHMDWLARWPAQPLVLETIAGASHFLPMERPEIVRAVLAAAMDAAW